MTKNTHSLETGMILSAKWGHEQTQVDFYLITKANPGSVQLVQIGSQKATDNTETDRKNLIEYIVPNPEVIESTTMRRKVHTMNRDDFVFIERYAGGPVGRVWNGKSARTSSFA